MGGSCDSNPHILAQERKALNRETASPHPRETGRAPPRGSSVPHCTGRTPGLPGLPSVGHSAHRRRHSDTHAGPEGKALLCGQDVGRTFWEGKNKPRFEGDTSLI